VKETDEDEQIRTSANEKDSKGTDSISDA